MKKITKIITTFLAITIILSCFVIPASANHFVSQVATALEKNNNGTYRYVVADYNRDGKSDIWAIKVKNTGTKSSEIHILNSSTNYQSYALQTGTCLGEAGSAFEFLAGDINGDSYCDLIAIMTSGTGSGRTEIHVLDGRYNFSRFLLQTAIPIEQAYDNYDFALADQNGDGVLDLYCIKLSKTSSKKVEIHVLSGKGNFQSFILQKATAFSQTNSSIFRFSVLDYNGDGTPELLGIKIKNTGSSKSELHILNGKNFQQFLLQIPTVLAQQIGISVDFCIGEFTKDSIPELFCVKNGWSNKTETHIINIDGAKPSRSYTREKQVTQILNSMISGGVYNGAYKENTAYKGNYYKEQCKGFAKSVHERIFNYKIGSTNRAEGMNYLIDINDKKTICVGSITDMKNETNVKNLFIKARPGDFVQMRRNHSGSHSAIVLSVTGQGITFFEANLNGKNGIVTEYYTWAQLSKANASMSLYTAANY